MQVVLKSNFDLAGLPSPGSLEVQEGTNLRALLDLLSRQCRLDFIDPKSGHPFDDTGRYVCALGLGDLERSRVFELNARRVYPRLDARLKAQGR